MDKDRILKEVGFMRMASPPYVNSRINEGAVFMATGDVRYQHKQQAQDGTDLFAYVWLNEPGAMLTTKQSIGSQGDIVIELESFDERKLTQAVDAFFDQHGGKGKAHY